MPTYQIFNAITGETVRTETVDDDKQRPIVPDGCALRLAPEPPNPVAPAPAGFSLPEPEPDPAPKPLPDTESTQKGT